MKKTLKIMLSIAALATLSWSAEITTYKPNYISGENVWIELEDKSENTQDWVGIYPEGSTNDWNNVIDWKWTKETSPTKVDKGDWYKFNLKDGKYEARFFLNNSFTLEDKVSFSVGKQGNVSLGLSKTNYEEQENIIVELSNLPANNGDWVGIYPKGSSNDWSNLVRWSYTNGSKSMNQIGISSGTLELEGVDAGEYEARLFYDNSFKLVKQIGFSVEGGEKEKIYGNLGKYKDVVEKYNGPDYRIYYPKGHTDNAPVVLFINNNHIDHGALMKYMATHGCFVIGAGASGHYSAQSVSKIFDRVLKESKKYHHLDTSKLGLVGHSLSGGLTLPVLKNFKEKGYGSKHSFVLSLDGWFAFGMNQDDLNQLDTTSMFILYGGKKGTGTDPRITLKLSELLSDEGKKSFFTIDSKNHMYSSSESDDLNKYFLEKKDLLAPINALLTSTFFGDKKAENYLFAHYENTIENIENNLKNIDSYYWGCHGKHGNAIEVIKNNDIDYCN